jgi:hypothetical protein
VCVCVVVPRPFRVPFGTTGCIILLSFPVIATITVIAVASHETLKFSLLVNLVGIAIYCCKNLAGISQKIRSCCPTYYSEIDIQEEDDVDYADDIGQEEEPITIT